MILLYERRKTQYKRLSRKYTYFIRKNKYSDYYSLYIDFTALIDVRRLLIINLLGILMPLLSI